MKEKSSKAVTVPDFTVENWGVYEAKALSKMPQETFQAFVCKCFGAKGKTEEAGIHGWKGPVPVWAGSAQAKRELVSAADVKAFANAVYKVWGIVWKTPLHLRLVCLDDWRFSDFGD